MGSQPAPFSIATPRSWLSQCKNQMPALTRLQLDRNEWAPGMHEGSHWFLAGGHLPHLNHNSDKQNCPTSWAAQNDVFCFVCFCVLWYYSRKWESQVVLDVWFSKRRCSVCRRSPCLLIRDACSDLYIFLAYLLCWRSKMDAEGRKALIFLVKYIFLKIILGTKVFFRELDSLTGLYWNST